MNIDAIKIFVATYQANSFALAAKELNLAPSSVSRSVATLEKGLKVRLFHRTTRKLSPTQEGELYYHRVLPLLEEFEQLSQELQLKSSVPSGKIKITASTSYGQIVLAPLLKKFHALYPKITIELVLSDTRLDLVPEQIDLAIRHGTLSDSSFIARKLSDVNYALVATPEFLASTSEILLPPDIAHHPIVAFTYKGFEKQWQFKKDDERCNINIQANFTISNAATIKECVKNHLGIAMLANWTIDGDIKSGALVRILPDWSVSASDENSSIWLLQPSKNFVPQKVKVFKEFLLAHC